MTKIKWYQWINPLFWIEAYVSMAVYQASRGLIRNVTDKVMEEHLKPTQTTIVVCPNGEHNKDLTATQQVASPKSASQTSLNPDIKLNYFNRLGGRR